MTEVARCEICGEPMPPGEQMFNFHGYSDPCPKPPLPKQNPPPKTAGELVLKYWPKVRKVYTSPLSRGDDNITSWQIEAKFQDGTCCWSGPTEAEALGQCGQRNRRIVMRGKRNDTAPHLLQPGEYGRWSQDNNFYAKPPGTDTIANLANHDVEEERDGTITVSPSIMINKGEPDMWHGYLEKGVWKVCDDSKTGKDI